MDECPHAASIQTVTPTNETRHPMVQPMPMERPMPGGSLHGDGVGATVSVGVIVLASRRYMRSKRDHGPFVLDRSAG